MRILLVIWIILNTLTILFETKTVVTHKKIYVIITALWGAVVVYLSYVSPCYGFGSASCYNITSIDIAIATIIQMFIMYSFLVWVSAYEKKKTQYATYMILVGIVSQVILFLFYEFIPIG